MLQFTSVMNRAIVYGTFKWPVESDTWLVFVREISEELTRGYFCGYFACKWWLRHSSVASFTIIAYIQSHRK